MNLTINIEALKNRYGNAKAIDICKAAGFTAMDYSLCEMADDNSILNGENYRAAAQEIRAIADEKQFPCVQTHAPFTFTLEQWEDPEIFENVIFARMVRSIEISAILGAKVIVIHPLHHMTYHGHEEEIFQLNMEYYGRLIPYAKEYGIKIGVENMFQWDPLRHYIIADTCSNSKEFVRYIDTLNSHGSPLVWMLVMWHCRERMNQPPMSCGHWDMTDLDLCIFMIMITKMIFISCRISEDLTGQKLPKLWEKSIIRETLPMK